MVGMDVPLLPLAHQYVKTGQVPELVGRNTELTEAGLPILRHQDQDLYFREHVRPPRHRLATPTGRCRWTCATLEDDGEIDRRPPCRRCCPSPRRTSRRPGSSARSCCPACASAKIETGFNGIFSFTPDGGPLIGESPDVAGFWIAEAVWVTHSAGVARAVAQLLVDGRSEIDLHGCDVHRFEEVQLAPDYVSETSAAELRRDLRHPAPAAAQGISAEPAGQPVPRPAAGARRGLPRGRRLGAPALVRGQRRAAGRAARRVAAAAARRLVARSSTRPSRRPRRGAPAPRSRMYDMTPLKRLEVSGPGALALLQRLTTGKMDKTVGAVTYTLLLDEAGGIRSDVTVARLAEQTVPGRRERPLDLDYLRRQLAVRRQRPGPRHHRRHLLHRAVGAAGPRARAGR